MRRAWTWGMIGAGLLGAAGCGEPPDREQMLPPGVALPAKEVPDDQRAQAIGEAGLGPKPGVSGQPGETVEGAIAGAETASPTPIGQPRTTPTGLVYETVVEGSGPESKPGQRAKVHYTGTFPDGRKFDSSRDEGREPFELTIGREGVIAGWIQGIPGMKVGERRKLTVPPALGYGDGAYGEIPGGSTLLFDIEMLEVK